MRIYTTFLLFLTLSIVHGSLDLSLAQGQEIQLTPSKDNTLFSESGAESNGSGQYLFFGSTNQGSLRRGLVAFDLAAAIPTGAVVQSAILRVVVNKTISGQHTANVHRVLQNWGEGSSDAGGEEGAGAGAATTDATWTHALFNTVEWNTVGGDFEIDVLTSTAVGGLGATDFPSTAAFVAAVQSWLDSPDQNFGVIILGNEGASATAKRIGSKDGPEANRPQLIVTYTVSTASEDLELPRFLTSLDAYPNPLRDRANIAFELSDARQVRVDLVDVTGRVVRTPVSSILPAGAHSAQVDARDLAPGLYLLRLTSEGQSAVKTIIVQ